MTPLHVIQYCNDLYTCSSELDNTDYKSSSPDSMTYAGTGAYLRSGCPAASRSQSNTQEDLEFVRSLHHRISSSAEVRACYPPAPHAVFPPFLPLLMRVITYTYRSFDADRKKGSLIRMQVGLFNVWTLCM